MARRVLSRKPPEGFIVVMRLRKGIQFDLISSEVDELDLNCYELLLPSPLPMLEFDFPSDVFNMFKNGSPQVDLAEEVDKTNIVPLWNQGYPTEKTNMFWKTGDLLLFMFRNQMYEGKQRQAFNYVKVLVEGSPEYINLFCEDQRYKSKYKVSQIKDSDFYLINAGDLPQFSSFTYPH